MTRFVFTLAALLLAGVVLAVPAPEPFVSGWGKPVDPHGDCKIRRSKGVLTFEMPGTDHDYDPRRKRSNAPRLPREFEGDFVIQVRLHITRRPSVESEVVKQQADLESELVNQRSFVASGFLLILPDEWIRLEYRAAGPRMLAGGSAVQIVRGMGEGGLYAKCDHRSEEKWPFKSEPEHVYLRLERWGYCLSHSISPDGKAWMTVGGGHIIGLPAKLKVCLAAYTTSSDPSKVIFDQLTITQGKKREQWEFVSGWGDPVDPDKDCKIKRDKDALTIEMPGSAHEYDPIRKRFNAPRLLSKLEGDFDLVVRVLIEYRPSAQSTVKGQPSCVSAGFLLIYPEETDFFICVHLDYAVSRQGNRSGADADALMLAYPRRENPAPKKMEVDSYALKKAWFRRHGKANGIGEDGGILWDRGWQNWPLPQKADIVYLRLEQRGEWSCFFISPDGRKWTPLSHQRSLPAKGKVALAAYSTSTEPSKVTFDQLKLARGKKKSK